MKNLTDLQLCGCVILKYSLNSQNPELFTSLCFALIDKMGMDIGEIFRIMADIKLTKNTTSFCYTGELDKKVQEMYFLTGVSNN
jgi:hypothetical protein